LPQEPQFAGSSEVTVHVSPQSVAPVPHTELPPLPPAPPPPSPPRPLPLKVDDVSPPQPIQAPPDAMKRDETNAMLRTFEVMTLVNLLFISLRPPWGKDAFYQSRAPAGTNLRIRNEVPPGKLADFQLSSSR
jgi:hypothetical protein